MPAPNDKPTIISMAIIASALATLLHEGLGHGITAWLRGDIPTELTSNHLSSLQPDRWVDAAGTLVNLAVGAACLLIARQTIIANTRYFFFGFSPRSICSPAPAISSSPEFSVSATGTK